MRAVLQRLAWPRGRASMVDAPVASGHIASGAAVDPADSGAGCWTLSGLGKTHATANTAPTHALQDLTLAIGEGEIVAVTGPSGAGKTTLGRLLCGLDSPSAGRIAFGGVDLTAVPARQRRVAHMAESFALYPTRSVAQNIASPLEAPGHAGRIDAAERQRRIAEVLALTEMGGLAARLPSQLSGGQKQRVALCRALVQSPSLFVLDEPIGHLDARLRHHLRGEIRRRQRALRPGTLWLTPDGGEAMAVADRLVMLVGGRLLQIGAPGEVFAEPAHVSVARLLGDPAMNVLPVEWLTGNVPSLRIGSDSLHPATAPVSPAWVARFAPLLRGGRLQLGLRPGELRLRPADAVQAHPADGSTDVLLARVYAVEPLGRQTLVTVEVGGQRLRVKTAADRAWPLGAPVQLAYDAARALAFDADSGLLLAPAVAAARA